MEIGHKPLRQLSTLPFCTLPRTRAGESCICTNVPLYTNSCGISGYRNRMVHFYHEIGERELYDICRDRLADIEGISDTLGRWLREHPEKVTGLQAMK
jgi:hypothetical protein